MKVIVPVYGERIDVSVIREPGRLTRPDGCDVRILVNGMLVRLEAMGIEQLESLARDLDTHATAMRHQANEQRTGDPLQAETDDDQGDGQLAVEVRGQLAEVHDEGASARESAAEFRAEGTAAKTRKLTDGERQAVNAIPICPACGSPREGCTCGK